MCLWLWVSSPGQVRAGSGKPSGSDRTLAFPERRRRCSGLPGEGWGGGGHPWASHCVLCAGRGARHMLQLQRTLDTHSIPGRARPCLQSSPRIFANPLLLPCRPRSSRSGLRAAYVNSTLITRAAAADTYCSAVPCLGSNSSEGTATPPSRNTGGQ